MFKSYILVLYGAWSLPTIPTWMNLRCVNFENFVIVCTIIRTLKNCTIKFNSSNNPYRIGYISNLGNICISISSKVYSYKTYWIWWTINCVKRIIVYISCKRLITKCYALQKRILRKGIQTLCSGSYKWRCLYRNTGHISSNYFWW